MYVSNSLDPDQARQFVGPDLGPDCLRRLSADQTRQQKVNYVFTVCSIDSFFVPVINISVMSG